jgi:pSer/pThr/pTyr-binding forkhead associated (FHA) protein
LTTLLWHHRYVSSSHIERLAQAAYEAHRNANDTALPPWEDATEPDRQTWRTAMSAVAGENARTRSNAAPTRALHIQAGDRRHVVTTEVTVGREGTLVVRDEFASASHARLWVAHGRWYVEDLGSTNGTWLNGRRIRAAQLLKRGDKIAVGHTILTVTSA